jgi:hypothetical protein
MAKITLISQILKKLDRNKFRAVVTKYGSGKNSY